MMEGESRIKASIADGELLENRKHFHSVVEASQDAIITITEKGIIKFCNESTQRMFGYSSEVLAGRHISALMPERYLKLFAKIYDKADDKTRIRTGGKAIETYGLRYDGSEFPIELLLSVWEDAGKKYLTGIIRDTTRKRKAINKLRKLSLAVEQSPVPIIIADRKGRIEYDNRKFNVVTG